MNLMAPHSSKMSVSYKTGLRICFILVESHPGSAGMGTLGRVAVEQGLAPDPALRAVTHLGFQFCDLQVQFIQVLVHKGDECLKEKYKPGIDMEALATATPWRPPLRPYCEDQAQCDNTRTNQGCRARCHC